jgi:non-specific serine/threonine protein kinase
VLVAAAVAALALCAVAAALILGGGDDDSDAPEGGNQAAAPAAPAAEPPASGGSGSGWREITPAPTARQQVPAVTYSGSVWLLGGLTSHGATDTVEGFDPVTNSWKTAPKLPARVHHSMAVNYRDELVVIGGWIPEGGNPSAVTSKRVFVLREGAKWEELPSLRHGRAAGAAAVVDGKIVVVGGQAEGKLVPETEVFDGKAWRDAAPLPTPREHIAAAADREYLYAVGGRNLSSDNNSAAFERYDPKADEWERLPNLPTARGGLGATVAGNHVIAAGGEEPTSVRGTVEAFDIDAGRWMRLEDLPTPRHGLGVASIGTRVFVLGGARRPGHFNSAKAAEAIDVPAGG